jgi:4,5-DOPA dioxygenase extradiol
VSRAAAVFLSHGSPTTALEDDPYTAVVRGLARHRPAAVLILSAHWTTGGAVGVTAADRHRLIYDFGGFPEELYQLTYPARGDPDLAGRTVSLLEAAQIPARLDGLRGLDHGAWIPMRIAWPDAKVPVVQVSLPAEASPEALVRLGRALTPLREQGVLLLGSGGLVHNLYLVNLADKDRAVDPWAREFDAWVAERLERLDLPALLRYRDEAPAAAMAVPTTEHFDPLFVVLGAASPGERVQTLFEGFHYGNLGMRSFQLQPAAHPKSEKEKSG